MTATDEQGRTPGGPQTRPPGTPRSGQADLFDGRSVFSMFRGVKSPRPGTMPAGFVLVIIVAGLLVAMFVNADATARKSKANLACDGCWRQTVSSVIADFSDFFRFTSPRQSIDQALGRTQDSGESTDELKAQLAQQAGSGSGGTVPGGAPAEVSTAPKLRAPTPEQPLKLWVGGDSITGDFGRSLARVSSATGLFVPTHDYKVSSGLTRPDYFNWPEHLVKDVVPSVDPDVVVIMFGANDAQNMPAWKGTKASVRFSDEWLEAYRQRVADTMDLLKSPDNDRLVIWTGAVAMGPSTGIADGMEKLNHIYWSEAQKRPWVKYFDSHAYFVGQDGQYRPSLPMADGQTKLLRASDNIHLSGAGADRLAWAVIGRLAKEIDLTRSQAIPPVEQLAPPDVVERAEVPAS